MFFVLAATYPQGEADGYLDLHVLTICMVWCFSGVLVWRFSGMNFFRCGVSAGANPLSFNENVAFRRHNSGLVWRFSVDNFRESQAYQHDGGSRPSLPRISPGNGFGADRWRAGPEFKTTLWRCEIEGWPAQFELS